jgi:hypothetical protein
MGWLIPKTYLRWQEPDTVRRAREARDGDGYDWPALLRLKVGLSTSGMFLVTWAIFKLDPNKHPPPLSHFLLVILPAGFFFAYIHPWLMSWANSKSTSEILVMENGVAWVVGSTRSFWKYKYVPSCRIASAGPHDQAVSVLELHDHLGGSLVLGINPSVSLEELARVLAERGVQVEDLTSSPGP